MNQNIPFNFSSPVASSWILFHLGITEGVWKVEISATDDLYAAQASIIHWLCTMQHLQRRYFVNRQFERVPINVYATAQDGYVGSIVQLYMDVGQRHQGCRALQTMSTLLQIVLEHHATRRLHR